MKKTPLIILDEHPDWLNPLYAEFKKRGVPYQKIDISAAAYDPSQTEIQPFYVNRLSPSAGKRGHGAAFNFTYDYLSYLESNGARVVNGAHTVLLETSKAQQARLLTKLNIPHPKTIVLNNLEQLRQYVDSFTFPVVLKPNRGGSGMGIQRFNTQTELLAALNSQSLTMPEEQVILLQEFIQPRDGHIVRVETINGKVIYGMKVFTEGTFNLCPSDNCDLSRHEPETVDSLGYCVATPSDTVRFELYPDLPADVVEAVEKIVAEAKLEVAGIEYVVDHLGQWHIYDINALSILRASFKEEYGIDAWSLLADFFVAEYEKAVKLSKPE